MPDPISQEQIDKMVEEARGGISQGPITSNIIAENAPIGGTVIPPNINQPLNIGSQIDQTVNPLGASAQDLATIQQAQAQFDPAAQIPVSPVTATGTPGQAALMPTLNQPINVGTTSGSIIGSHGVYVDPGTVAPWGAFMDQQKQLQVAQAEQDKLANLALKEQDLAKKAKDKAFQFERPEIPTADDPHFQESLNKSGTSIINSYVDQAKQVYGKDWQTALKTDTRIGREFQESMDGLNVVARNANLMSEKFGEIQAGIEDGSTYYDDGVLKAFRDYQQAIGEFEEGDITALAGMRQKLQKIDGEMELNSFLNDKGILSNVVAQATGGTGVGAIGDFMKLRTSNRKSYDKNIDAMVKNVRKAKGLDSSYTDKDIRNALEGHFQNTSTSKTTLTAKPSGGSGGNMSDKDIRINKGNKEINVDNTRAGGGVGSYNSNLSIPLKQIKKGQNLDGLQEIGPDGSLTAIPNIQQAIPVELVYVDVKDANGNITQEKGVTIQYEQEVEKPQSITDKALSKPVEFESVPVTKVVRYDDIKDQMRTIYGDKVNDEFETSTVPETQVESFDIEGMGSFTKQELLDNGWTEENIEQLKNQ